MERLIQKKMVAFLEGHKKLNSAQHGFRAKHSCLTQLLETIHAWAQGLNKGSSTHVVFIDFRKAFDKVPHQRLLLKLDHIGVRGKLLESMNSIGIPSRGGGHFWPAVRCIKL